MSKSDPFRHVKPGDRKISATAWNRMLDAIRPVPAAVGSGPLGSERRIGLVTVENVDATDYDRFDVLAVSDILISPTDNEPEFLSRVALNVTLPTWPDDAGRFVILAEPLAAGDIGRAWASGVCQASINVLDEAHRFADVADGSAVLTSRSTGAAQILWKETGTGTKWSIVRLGGCTGTAESPLELAPATPDTETLPDPLDSWDIEDQGSDDGVTIPVITDVAYNHKSATPVLYGFRRELTFDSSGRLVAVSEPTRYTIDAPVQCSLGGS